MNLVAAAVQMTSGADLDANLRRAAELVRRARARGAELVVLPENFALFAPGEGAKLAIAEALDGEGRILGAMGALARETSTWLVLGGMPERGPDPGRVHNTCVLLAPDGRVAAAYRKIHLFDVAIPDGATYQESATVAPGGEVVVADTPFGGLGLSVCYDLRFPELYRQLVAGGARIVVVPAAFTLHTGKDHWHVLLRARAIENQVFVVAAAQFGRHDERRQTYGHALIVDPWGTVIAEASDGEGVVVGELRGEVQERVRREVPCLGHRRL